MKIEELYPDKDLLLHWHNELLIKLRHIHMDFHIETLAMGMAKLAVDNAVKKIYKWLDSECNCFIPTEQRWFCPKCKQALKGLIK